MFFLFDFRDLFKNGRRKFIIFEFDKKDFINWIVKLWFDFGDFLFSVFYIEYILWLSFKDLFLRLSIWSICYFCLFWLWWLFWGWGCIYSGRWLRIRLFSLFYWSVCWYLVWFVFCSFIFIIFMWGAYCFIFGWDVFWELSFFSRRRRFSIWCRRKWWIFYL